MERIHLNIINHFLKAYSKISPLRQARPFYHRAIWNISIGGWWANDSYGFRTSNSSCCHWLSFIVYIHSRIYKWRERLSVEHQCHKKRNKGQTFKEWFLYSRYREEIPKILLILYFVVVAIHPLVLIFCVIFSFIKPLEWVGPVLAKGISAFDVIWILILHILFCQIKPGYKYERWIERRKGNRKK